MEISMKVKELIEILGDFNPNAEITTPYSKTIAIGWINGESGEKNDACIVFIEGCDKHDRIEK